MKTDATNRLAKLLKIETPDIGYETEQALELAANEIERLRALTAAAEVGESDAQAIQRWEEEDVKDEEETQKLKNHTIERCAQEIREILQDEYGAERLDEIVERIRALKQ